MLPPPPRQVVGGPGFQIWLGRIIILPHTLMGLGMLAFLLLTVELAACGQPVTGVVKDGYVITGTKGGPHHWVVVEYEAGGQWHQGRVEVPGDVYEKLGFTPGGPGLDPQFGDKVPHVKLKRAWFFGERVEYLATSSLWTGGCALPVVAFWWTIVGTFLREFWVKPFRRRRLVRDGKEAVGEVLVRGKRMARGAKAMIEFRFHDESGREVRAKHEVPVPDEQQLQVGASCTVLYDPERPERGMIYEFCGYRAAPTFPG